jgi:hypothetical protein
VLDFGEPWSPLAGRGDDASGDEGHRQRASAARATGFRPRWRR